MSSIDGNATSVPPDPGLQLAPPENKGPDFNLLKKAFEDCVRDNQPFIDQCRLNYETRYCGGAQSFKGFRNRTRWWNSNGCR